MKKKQNPRNPALADALLNAMGRDNPAPRHEPLKTGNRQIALSEPGNNNSLHSFYRAFKINLKDTRKVSPALISLATDVARDGLAIETTKEEAELSGEIIKQLGLRLLSPSISDDTSDLVITIASLSAGCQASAIKDFSLEILAEAVILERLPMNFIISVPRNHKERRLLSRIPIEDVNNRIRSEKLRRETYRYDKEDAGSDPLDSIRQAVIQAKSIAFNLRLNPKIITPPLNADDIRLVLAWKNKSLPIGTEPTLISMLDILDGWDISRLCSARSAELAAAQFYRQLGSTVTDVSIGQLNNHDTDWKTHDLIVDGKPVDIKNARQSFSDPSRYSEYLVPQFKEERRAGRAVSIVAVFSEYLSAGHLLAGESAQCTIIGEASQAELDSLVQWINSTFDGVLFSKEGSFSTGAKLPGWCFDYDTDMQADGNVAGALERIGQQAALSSLSLSEAGCSLMPFAFTSEKSLIKSMLERKHAAPEHSLQIWESLRSMKSFIGWSRRSLFIFVVGYTLAQAKSGVQDWSPNLLTEWLFLDKSKKATYWPMCLYDPLRYIAGIITSMAVLWRKSRETLNRLSSFRLASPWILIGSDANGNELTLMAYCGGWIKDGNRNVKCGQSPLILGVDQSCPHCNRLICHKCGYCTNNCTGMAMRQRESLSTALEVHSSEPITQARPSPASS
jgi:hypothetical protein